MPNHAQHSITGWDIGGAHLKCAKILNGHLSDIKQIRCPLWHGEENLIEAFNEAGSIFLHADRHRITMTGELAECFPTRFDGVKRIVMQCRKSLSGNVSFYAIEKGFIASEEAIQNWPSVASANWYATADYFAAHYPDAILIDIGSTTTDIIPICNGVVVAKGRTDTQRLKWGELVYTGVARSSLMSITRNIPFMGEWYPLMNENYSETADLYRITGELAPDDDAYPASDGRTKQISDCYSRLARMLGMDIDDATTDAWNALAHYFKEQQVRMLHDALGQVLSRMDHSAIPIIGTGAGHFLVRILAHRANMTFIDSVEAIKVEGDLKRLVRTCTPAVAVALMNNDIQ